jgi:UDP-2,3-diacylglucosamine hydrolase
MHSPQHPLHSPSQSPSQDLAPKPWLALFISDLHLQATQPRTLAAFFDFLQQYGCQTKALYLLGDLFEYWAGDDDLSDPCNAAVVQALRTLSDTGVSIFWLAGNRDFLIGADFAKAAGATLLCEPHIVEFNTEAGTQQLCLVHGDAQCTDDSTYMAFRAQVRQPVWQQTFLAMPLAQRKAIIEGMRKGSREQQRENSVEIMDVNPQAIAALFTATGTQTLIHGHTHRPALHHPATMLPMASPLPIQTRHVLPDWDCDAEPVRGGFIALGSDGVLRHFALNGELLHIYDTTLTQK